jgi:lipopolysaccharide export system permease protein
MRTFDRYITGQLAIALALVLAALAGVVVLVQALRFIDLIVESGASAGAFWALVALALPRFAETLAPLALTIAVVFVYARMIGDRELVAMRAVGTSPARLAAPALTVGALLACALWASTLWATPASLAAMARMQHALATQLPAVVFQEGTFATPTDGLTVYMRARGPGGEMRGLMLHDARPGKGAEGQAGPATILARRGVIAAREGGGHEIEVWDGARQVYDADAGTLHRLDFGRYTLALPPPQGAGQDRWLDAGERPLGALLFPDPDDARAAHERAEFAAEAHRRFAQPLLAPAFVAVALCILMGGQASREGPGLRATAALLAAAALQGAFLAVLTAAGTGTGAAWGPWALWALWAVVLAPGLAAGACLCGLLRPRRGEARHAR